jgi:hypothetical protein
MAQTGSAFAMYEFRDDAEQQESDVPWDKKSECKKANLIMGSEPLK